MTVLTDHANSVQGVVLRVTQLDASGVAISASEIVTDRFVNVGFTPIYESGFDLTHMTMDGSPDGEFKSPDQLRRVEITVAVNDPDPGLVTALSGGDELISGLIQGYAAPPFGQFPLPYGISLEVWSRAIVNGRPDPTHPFWYWVFPYVQLWESGQIAFEGQVMPAFTGYGYGNSGWSSGDWPFGNGSAYQFARASSAPAVAGMCGTLVLIGDGTYLLNDDGLIFIGDGVYTLDSDCLISDGDGLYTYVGA